MSETGKNFNKIPKTTQFSLGSEQNPARNVDELPEGTGIVLDEDFGMLCYYRDGKYHREDGPAVFMIYTGTVDPMVPPDCEYWVNGELHRVDGPAVEYSNGTKEWWVNGERHREDGPAIEWAHGTKEWWVNGERHRKDGPAVIGPDGTKEWFLHGVRHRIDGPAIEWDPENPYAVYEQSSPIYYLHGERVHPEDFPKMIEELMQAKLMNCHK